MNNRTKKLIYNLLMTICILLALSVILINKESWCLSGIFIVLFCYFALKIPFENNEKEVSPVPVKALSEEEIRMSNEQFELAERNRKKAYELIADMCRQKNIDLSLKHHMGGPHGEIPETWIFEKPIPLNAAELLQIYENPEISFKKIIAEDGNVYATEFSFIGGSIVYETNE